MIYGTTSVCHCGIQPAVYRTTKKTIFDIYVYIYICIFQIGLRLKEGLLGVSRSLTVSVSPQGIKILNYKTYVTDDKS